MPISLFDFHSTTKNMMVTPFLLASAASAALDEASSRVLASWRLRDTAASQMSAARDAMSAQRDKARRKSYMDKLFEGASEASRLVEEFVGLGMKKTIDVKTLAKLNVNLTALATVENLWRSRYVELRARNCTNQAEREHFKKADVSGDGSISVDEFVAVVHDADQSLSVRDAFFSAELPRPFPESLQLAAPPPRPSTAANSDHVLQAKKMLEEARATIERAADATKAAREALENDSTGILSGDRSARPSAPSPPAFFSRCTEQLGLFEEEKSSSPSSRGGGRIFRCYES